MLMKFVLNMILLTQIKTIFTHSYSIMKVQLMSKNSFR